MVYGATGHEEKISTADESAAASLWRDRLQIYADKFTEGFDVSSAEPFTKDTEGRFLTEDNEGGFSALFWRSR
jgi:hypothetical protein